MPASEIDVVRANSAAFSAMDVDAMLELYAPDAEVIDRRRVSIGSFSGHEELRAYYLSIFHTASELHEELSVLAHAGPIVAAQCELVGRLAADTTGATVTVTYGLAMEIRDGRIVRLQIAEDGEHALELTGIGG